jgi:hypothetical protein
MLNLDIFTCWKVITMVTTIKKENLKLKLKSILPPTLGEKKVLWASFNAYVYFSVSFLSHPNLTHSNYVHFHAKFWSHPNRTRSMCDYAHFSVRFWTVPNLTNFMGAYVYFNVRFESHFNLTRSMGKLIHLTLNRFLLQR